MSVCVKPAYLGVMVFVLMSHVVKNGETIAAIVSRVSLTTYGKTPTCQCKLHIFDINWTLYTRGCVSYVYIVYYE